VAQLSGYVAEHSAYHHGEQSLSSTIIGLAQNFVGANNLNLLEPVGQFGTRLQGGKDSASPRYVFTHLSSIARRVFHPADDNIVKYLNDDGQSIEPEWYIPVVPLSLINGCEGIGTGWSTSIPNYNPRDLVENLRRKLRGEPFQKMHPWYRGFTGTIEPVGEDKYKISGTIRQVDATTIEITELPVQTWTQNYKEFLEDLLMSTDKKPAFIKDYKEYHTDTTVHFQVTLSEQNMAKALEEGLEKTFKMSTTKATSNMVLFDRDNRLRKYGSVDEILEDFYDLRIECYHKRKNYLTDHLSQEWSKLDNKVRFVLAIVEGKLSVHNRKKADIIEDLKLRGFTPFAKGKSSENENNQQENDIIVKADYDYLLSMPIYTLTQEKVCIRK